MSAMRGKIECCNGCTRRRSGCHSVCEDYKREKAELEASRSAVRTNRDADADYTSYRIDAKQKRRQIYNMRTRTGGKKF